MLSQIPANIFTGIPKCLLGKFEKSLILIYNLIDTEEYLVLT